MSSMLINVPPMSSAQARTSPRPDSSITCTRWYRNVDDAIAYREPERAHPWMIPLRTQYR
eukprot:6499510-Pyramimonas_sp.AAC.1